MLEARDYGGDAWTALDQFGALLIIVLIILAVSAARLWSRS